MSAEPSGESFFETGLDFAAEEFSPAEKAEMLKWYDDVHGYRDLDLAAFARFWIEVDPGGFKRLKRHLMTLGQHIDGVSLPVSAGVLMWVYSYTATGNGKGAFYEIIACRALGLSKAEITEVVGLAALMGGPAGMNPLGELCEQYFEEWAPQPSSAPAWPTGWAPDVRVLRSGIDATSDAFPEFELERVKDWYLRTHGEVPGHVDRLARWSPQAYKTQRIRFEMAITGSIPAQLVPLLMLHLGVVRMAPDLCRRSAQLARGLGVRRQQILDTVFWGAVCGGDVALETAVTAISDVLDSVA